MFENSKSRQVPPCSCCGRDQLAYEFFFKLDMFKVPSADGVSRKSLFFCPDCYEEKIQPFTHYTSQIKEEWSPV